MWLFQISRSGDLNQKTKSSNLIWKKELAEVVWAWRTEDFWTLPRCRWSRTLMDPLKHLFSCRSIWSSDSPRVQKTTDAWLFVEAALYLKKKKKKRLQSLSATRSNYIKICEDKRREDPESNLGRVKFDWIAFIFQTSFTFALKEQSSVYLHRAPINSAAPLRPSAASLFFCTSNLHRTPPALNSCRVKPTPPLASPQRGKMCATWRQPLHIQSKRQPWLQSVSQRRAERKAKGARRRRPAPRFLDEVIFQETDPK